MKILLLSNFLDRTEILTIEPQELWKMNAKSELAAKSWPTEEKKSIPHTHFSKTDIVAIQSPPLNHFQTPDIERATLTCFNFDFC